MNVYSVGVDELLDYELDYLKGVDWVVYWYESGDYDGNGEAVGYSNGVIRYANLSHCSCYGPCEDGWDGSMSVEEFLKQRENIHDLDFRDEIKVKVCELLGT